MESLVKQKMFLSDLSQYSSNRSQNGGAVCYKNVFRNDPCG